MLMWLLALAGIFACYFISEKQKNPRKFFLVSAGIVIVLILGSRYFINGFTDEIAYNQLYQGYSNISFEELLHQRWNERDFGFYLTYWVMAQIVPWSQFPIYFITALFIFVTFRFIYKNTNATLIPVLLMFAFGIFSFYMAAYRQCFAMCICILAFEFAKKRGIRGLLPYAILVYIATTFHASALVFIPVYFFLRIKRNGIGYFAWVTSVLVTAFAGDVMMRYVADVFEKDTYLDTAVFSATGLYIQMVLLAVPFIISFLGLAEDKNLSTIQHAFLVIISIGAIFLLYKFIYPTYERVSYYYSFFIIAAFSNSVVNLKQRKGEKNYVLPAQMIVAVILIVLMLWRMPDDLVFFWQQN